MTPNEHLDAAELILTALADPGMIPPATTIPDRLAVAQAHIELARLVQARAAQVVTMQSQRALPSEDRPAPRRRPT